MKRLLGLLLVVGMVGCGIPVARLEDKGAKITKNEQGEVVRVNLFGTKITDAGMADLKGLTNLQKLDLAICRKITDAGLVHLVGLTNLQSLYLRRTKITDAGLKDVVKLQQLTHLWLYNTQITDEGLKELVKLQKLRNLVLIDTKTTKAGAPELLKALPNYPLPQTARAGNGLKPTPTRQPSSPSRGSSPRKTP